MEKLTQDIYCDECGEDFEITHNVSEEVVYCPLCGSDLFLEDDDEEEDIQFDDDYGDELDED